MGELIMVTGGSASGKSDFSEKLVKELDIKSESKVTYIATAEIHDDELEQRIIKHRERRPKHWKTVEACHDLVSPLKELVETEEIILLDSLTMFLSNKLLSSKIDDNALTDENALENLFFHVSDEMDQCINLIKKGKATVVVVTDEVGWGIVPSNFLGRTFKDLVGKANQILGSNSDEAYLVISGLPQKIK